MTFGTRYRMGGTTITFGILKTISQLGRSSFLLVTASISDFGTTKTANQTANSKASSLQKASARNGAWAVVFWHFAISCWGGVSLGLVLGRHVTEVSADQLGRILFDSLRHLNSKEMAAGPPIAPAIAAFRLRRCCKKLWLGSVVPTENLSGDRRMTSFRFVRWSERRQSPVTW